MAKFVTLEEAASLIKDKDTLISEGFMLHNFPAELIKALSQRFEKTGSPKAITLIYAAGEGAGANTGLDFLAREGLLKRVIAGHWNLSPNLGKLAVENKIEAYNLPQGTIAQLYRDMAAGKVGTVTHVGLKTFVDPRLDGGKLNSVTKEDIVELVTLGGKEQLFYKSQKATCCFLRGSYADEKGNISLEKEGVTLGGVSIAQAVKRNGGTVIVQ
ncbi:MAG: hypothetical protein LBV76_03685, partial [Deltaproteobacteria bacterium]|nr:hypothetical protein [Deltaproteobacteria bacterium]